MANYSVLKAAVQAVVKTNGNQEITGANMQSTLISIINSLGTGYQFMGVATPSTSPGTPDQNVFYIGGAGTYANFGTSITVPVGSICIFKYNGSWTKEQFSDGVQDEVSQIIKNLGSNIQQVSTTDGIQSNRYIKPDGYIVNQNGFIVTDAYTVVGATMVHFTGYTGSVYHSYAFYDSLGKYISGNTMPSSNTLITEDVTIPAGADTVIFCSATSMVSDFSCSIEYTEDVDINRRVDMLEELAKKIKESFTMEEDDTISYGELFVGTLYSFSTYKYTLLIPIYGRVNNVQVTCDNGATITIYKYVRNKSILTQIGSATATADGVLSVSCNDASFNGEFIAVGTTSKLAYRNTTANLFGSLTNDGMYRGDSVYDYSFKVNLSPMEVFAANSLSEYNTESVIPINSNAVTDTKAATKVIWYSGTMTSVGIVYDDPLTKHSEFLKADTYFNKQTVNFYYAIYAWYFFDSHFYPLAGFKPSSTQDIVLDGKLPNIPSNAAYVVINQRNVSFVDLYAFQKDTVLSRWAGKNVLFIGDSFIDQNYLPNQICSLLNCNAINRGISGSVVASKGGSSYQSLVDRLDGYNDDQSSNEHYHSFPTSCDAVIINCSINDYGTSVPMGTMEAGYSDKATFFGGVHYVINKLVEKYGNTPILWINATHRNSANLPEFVINSDGTFTITENSVNCSLKDYVLALEEVCNAYSVPVVDAYRKSRIQPLFSANKTAYTIDGLHPNDTGAKLIALRVLEAIEYIGY